MPSRDLLQRLQEMPVSLDPIELFNTLQDRYRWPIAYLDGQPTIEVILPSGNKDRSLFASDGYVIPDVVTDAYNRGYTLIFSRCEWINASVSEFTKALIKTGITDTEPSANIYIGMGKASISFPPHSHEYDVLVKSVEGVSTWVVSNEQFEVASQQVIWIPAWSDHAVVDIDVPKLSLTYSLL